MVTFARDEAGFFAYTAASRSEHYARYTAVLHLVTAAEGAAHVYRRYPEDQRGESPEEAVHLDYLLRHVWGGHPRYICIDNEGRDWAAKSQAAREVLEGWWEQWAVGS